MRQRWVFGVAFLVAGVMLAWQAAPAQDPLPWSSAYRPSAYAVPPVPLPEPPPPEEPPQPPRGPLKKCLGKCKDCLNKYGLCCWSHHNSLGCSNFEAEYRFVFGSCRTFYGEPCERKPAGGPGSPGAPSAYGPGSSGCACP